MKIANAVQFISAIDDIGTSGTVTYSALFYKTKCQFMVREIT
jgi:hypothetical protein